VKLKSNNNKNKKNMKKITLCVLLALLATAVVAQQEGKIRGGLNLGGAIPSGGGFGAALDAQLGYNIADNMNVGVRGGMAAMLGTDKETTVSAAGNFNFLATFTYFLNPCGGAFAPFAGAGTGIYKLGASSASLGGQSAEGGTLFGGMLTAGFEIGKLRVAAEYNLLPASPIKATVGDVADRKNSYLGVTIGFFFGGGKWGGGRR